MSERAAHVIVDDEPPARQLLREYLARMPAVEVIAECANGFEAVKGMASRRPTSCSSTSRCPSSMASRCSS